jgi:hypothetical protein
MRNPFVGERYAERRILILGESSWGTGMEDASYVAHWLEHPKFLEHPGCSICAQVGGSQYKRDTLNDALTTMMLWYRKPNDTKRRSPTDAERRMLWSLIAFGNFVTREMRVRVKDRPDEPDWREAADSFPAELKELKPRVCLVLDNPGGDLSSYSAPALQAAEVEVVRLPHLTMRPAPKFNDRAAAWSRCLAATQRT